MIIRNNQTMGALRKLFFLITLVGTSALFISLKKVNKEEMSTVYEYGKASYYGHPFIGRKTANGEIFTEYEYTCAHRTLPFGTKLKVTNLANNRSIIVRVNDRGPYVKNRILDLSIQGAKELGLMQSGVGNITIEMVHSKFSSLGSTNRMEKIAVDDTYAYIHMDDDHRFNEVYNYLLETNQLELNKKSSPENETEPVIEGTSQSLNMLDIEK